MEAWRVDPTMLRKEAVEVPTDLEFARRLKEAKAFYDSKPYLSYPAHFESVSAYKTWWLRKNGDDA